MQSRERGTVVAVGRGLLLSVAVLGFAARGAWAQCPAPSSAACPAISPSGCSANRMSIDIGIGSSAIVTNNSIAQYRVDFQNNPAGNPDACDANLAFLTVCCPGPDGNPLPGPSGCTHIPVTSQPCNINDGAPNCTACTGPFAFAAQPPDPSHTELSITVGCLVNVNPGVNSAGAEARIDSGYLMCQAAGGVIQPALAKQVFVLIATPTPTLTPTNTPTLTPNVPTVIPLVSSPTSSMGVVLILGLTLGIVGMLRYARRPM